jgi:hypothetical protein
MAANDLATLLGRVSEVSTREIENLIDELRGLREKLKADCDRIRGDVSEYAELSHGVMQLTANISDNANILPSAPDTDRFPYVPDRVVVFLALAIIDAVTALMSATRSRCSSGIRCVKDSRSGQVGSRIIEFLPSVSSRESSLR